MLVELPTAWIVVLNVAGWPIIQLGLAWVFTRMPGAWFHPRRPWAWEHRGRVYERVFRAKHWKHLLPDGGGWFSGGFSKRMLQTRSRGHLARYALETWRGELCHWAALAFAPVFFLWNPWWAGWVMAAYALAANLPCIVVQRYNRARLHHRLLVDH